MPYYRGDYYRGDYYRGDILGGLKRLAGVVGGGVKGFIGGGPIGALRGAATALVKTSSNVPQVAPPMMFAGGMGPSAGGIQVPSGTPGAIKQPGAGGAISRFLPGGETGYELAPRGYHINKAFLKGKPHVTEQGYVHEIVRNRQLNPANPRALRRAIRREQAFMGLVRRVIRGTGMKLTRTGTGGKRGRARKR